MHMESIIQNQLSKDWQFRLLSSIFRGHWALDPREAISAGPVLAPILLNRDWTGHDQSRDLDTDPDRDPYPFALVSKDGTVMHSSSRDGGKSWDKAPANSIAVIPLKGSMLKYSTFCTYGTEEIASVMLEAASSSKVIAIVLDIDSGGGAVDAVAPMVDTIAKIRKEFKKPVVASCDLCASAAYWTASACDKIVANNNISAEFGSIGVMCSFVDVKPYYEKQGYKFHTVYAPESTEKNDTFDQALKGEYGKIQEKELSPLAKSFQNAVKGNRPNLKTETPGVLKGEMYFAVESLEIGLIDEIGSLDSAVSLARSLSNKYTAQTYVQS